MKSIKVSWRAVFRQPIGILNPAGYTMGGTFPVEIFGQGDKWQAREIASPKRAVYTKLRKHAGPQWGGINAQDAEGFWSPGTIIGARKIQIIRGTARFPKRCDRWRQ